MSNVTRGERPAMSAAVRAAAQAVPRREKPEDELDGTDALAAMHDALVTISVPPHIHLSLPQMSFEKVGRWIVVDALTRDKDGKERPAKVRIASRYVLELRNALTSVLGDILRKGDRG